MYLPLQSILRLKFCENHKEQQIPVKGCSRGLNTSTNAKICSYTNTNTSHIEIQIPLTYKYKYLSHRNTNTSHIQIQIPVQWGCLPQQETPIQGACNVLPLKPGSWQKRL